MHQLAQQLPSDRNSLENWDDSEEEELPVEIKVTTSKTTIVSGLRVFSNYSVSALAFTTVGDGVLSTPILCQTTEDGKPIFTFKDEVVAFVATFCLLGNRSY